MKNSEKSAFGYGYANESSHQEVHGLTKREYFAAMAMQGMLANEMEMAHLLASSVPTSKAVAGMAIDYADELLKQLES